MPNDYLPPSTNPTYLLSFVWPTLASEFRKCMGNTVSIYLSIYLYYTQNPPGEWAENNPRLKVSLLLIRLLTITNFSFKLIVFNTNNY